MLFAMVCNMAIAQQYNAEVDEYDIEKKKRKVGIRVGLGFTSLTSPQFENPRISRGMQGAIYFRKNFAKGFHFNPEFGASIKGAKFKNDETEYSRISLFYIDLALLGMINLDNKNKSSIVIGAQGSYLMRSSLYIGRDPIAAFMQLPFKKFDYCAVAGYHFNTSFVGFQLSLKYGLANIAGDFANYNRSPASVGQNNQANFKTFKDVKPSLVNVVDVKNLSVELSLYF